MKKLNNQKKKILADYKRITITLWERPGKWSCWLNKIILPGILVSVLISALIMHKWAKIILKTFQKCQ